MPVQLNTPLDRTIAINVQIKVTMSVDKLGITDYI